MRLKVLVLTIVSILMLVACDTKKRVKAPEVGQSATAPASPMTKANAHVVKVLEVKQAKSYTYLRVEEGSKEYWIATAKQPIEVGLTMTYDEGLEMKDFASKELDKTFESIWFVGLMSSAGGSKGGAASPYSQEKMAQAKDISVEKVAGSLSIEELYTNKSNYAGKIVTVRGEVTKFNSGIMGFNWAHLQDGTKSGDYFDITVTTKAMVKMGDVVVFSGKVTLDKDFGAGYKYDVIIEEAELSDGS